MRVGIIEASHKEIALTINLPVEYPVLRLYFSVIDNFCDLAFRNAHLPASDTVLRIQIKYFCVVQTDIHRHRRVRTRVIFFI